ncbi:MAG: restriction endonuclease subunit S [Candidatus Nealsonbacteria bacterium]|nr:restriction endonuclease subunit S [Candidatus Nealsonbacteria bacterium]
MVKWINITEAVEITNNRVKPFSGECSYLATGDLNGGEIDKVVLVDYETKPSRADLLVNGGEIIVARMQATNKVLLVDEKTKKLIVSTGFLTLVPKIGFDADYLFHYFRSHIFQREKDKYCSGATQKAINNGAFKKLRIPSYSIDEQRKIAKILGCVEVLRQKRTQSIRLLENFLSTTFLNMFGDSQENPMKWKRGTIRDLVSDVKYGTSKKAGAVGSYPILRMKNITYEGGWDFNDLKYINLDDGEVEKYTVRRGDILFNRTNSKELVGKTAVYREKKPMTYAGYLIRVRVNKNANPEYISAFLNSSHGKTYLISTCKSIVGMANINAQELQDIPILLPPGELQEKYATTVNSALKVKEALLKSLSEMDNQFNVFVQSYFD